MRTRTPPNRPKENLVPSVCQPADRLGTDERHWPRPETLSGTYPCGQRQSCLRSRDADVTCTCAKEVREPSPQFPSCYAPTIRYRFQVYAPGIVNHSEVLLTRRVVAGFLVPCACSAEHNLSTDQKRVPHFVCFEKHQFAFSISKFRKDHCDETMERE
jgi:hypothetical protein